jgi:hypothetical protein
VKRIIVIAHRLATAPNKRAALAEMRATCPSSPWQKLHKDRSHSTCVATTSTSASAAVVVPIAIGDSVVRD